MIQVGQGQSQFRTSREMPPMTGRSILFSLALISGSAAWAEESTCYGTTNRGKLDNGVRLPLSGPNFETYSYFASLVGRTYVHTQVRGIVEAAYKALEQSAPGKAFVYGETGWPSGGSFEPHKTHQNGLSVDFMVPVLKAGRSAPLPTTMFNKFGYDIEFNAEGQYKEYEIDIGAMAAHLVELHEAAQAAGAGIWRVIFDPALQPFLFKTTHGSYLRRHITFSTKRSWVRHDEHYHVDFQVACYPLKK